MLHQNRTVTVYFVRHGQTDWNAEERLQGQIDIALNDVGRAQARRNGRALAGAIENPATLDYVSSPLRRCRETMEIVRTCLGLPASGYRVEPAIMEINFGRWQGLTWEELRARDPAAFAARCADPWNTVAPGDGGESYAMLSARALRWYAGVARDTVVIAHGGIKRCLRGHIEGIDPAQIPLLGAPQDKVMVIRNGACAWI